MATRRYKISPWVLKNISQVSAANKWNTCIINHLHVLITYMYMYTEPQHYFYKVG